MMSMLPNARYTWDPVIQKTSKEQWQAMLDIHLTTQFRLLRSAAPYLRETAKQQAAREGPSCAWSSMSPRSGARVATSASGGTPQGRLVSPVGAMDQTAAASSHDATRRLRRINAPTLVLHGGADEVVPVANATWLASRIPRAKLRLVRGGTHLLLLESPAARQALRAWLDEHRARVPAVGRAFAAWPGRSGCPTECCSVRPMPLRRAIRAGSRRVRRPSPQQGPGTP